MRSAGFASSMTFACLIIVASIGVCVSEQKALAEPGTQSGSPAYTLLDRLTVAPRQVTVHQFSSHNKTGHNGDENWPLYKDEHGDDVIFDAAGPGCVRSIWGTHFAEDAVLKFTFDGEEEPRYKIREIDFFEGKHPHFPAPLVSYERRGHYAGGLAGNSFVPIPFEKSLRITIEGESRFFHVLYERYPHGTPIKTFDGSSDDAALVDCFERLGEDPLAEEDLEVIEVEAGDNKPGAAVVLFERKDGSGVVRKIVIEADGSDTFFQESELGMRWDGHVWRDVNAPTGFFFGCCDQANDMRSLPLRVERLEGGRVRLSCYFPMPFWREAHIVWRNGSRYPLNFLKAKVYVGKNELPASRGCYFTTLYRSGTTTYGRDWLLYERPGTGWFVGAVQSMQHQHYCEGDEHFTIDGAISPQINGTGSEDYYLACFWPNLDFDSPFACVVGDIQEQGGGHMAGAYRIPSCYCRYHLEAPIPFYGSIDARIQHGGLSYLRSNYRSLGYCYLRKQPVLRRTDFLDVGNPASEAAHAYKATTGEMTGVVEAKPEGAYFDTVVADRGRRHAEGEITFRVAIEAENEGVRLRRRLDQGSQRQAAAVYVDGEYAGVWLHGYHNEHLRWFDSDFDIHPEKTAGKSSLDIRLVVVGGEGRGPFTDFKYEVYSFDAAGERGETAVGQE